MLYVGEKIVFYEYGVHIRLDDESVVFNVNILE